MSKQYVHYLYTADNGNVNVKKLQTYDTDETHILTKGKGYGYDKPMTDAEKWVSEGWSMGCHQQGIFIPADADINQYIPTINAEIAIRLNREIVKLQETLIAVESWVTP